MKCSSCGAELAEGVKFCSECGTRVGVEPIMTAKEFFGEPVIAWDDDNVSMSELDVAIEDDDLDLVVHEVQNRIQKKAMPGRVLTSKDEGFEDKIENFIAEFNMRIGDDGQEERIREGAVVIFDYGRKGIGKRGFVFTDEGVYNLTNKTPAFEDGKCVGGRCITGYIPWKIFCKFAKSVDGKTFWRIKMSDIISSDEVDDELKEWIKNEEHVERIHFDGLPSVTGLDPEFMAEELVRIKDTVRGNYHMTAEEFFGEI